MEPPEAKRPRVVLKKGRGHVSSPPAPALPAPAAAATPRRTSQDFPPLQPPRISSGGGGSVLLAAAAAAKGASRSPRRVHRHSLQAPASRTSGTAEAGASRASLKALAAAALKPEVKHQKVEVVVKTEKKAEKVATSGLVAAKRENVPAPHPQPQSAPGVAAKGAQVVSFDVGGTIVRTSAKLIRSKPSTLLAQWLSEAANTAEPIFVDADPERFRYVLDWYRYGEMNVPRSVPLASLLRDAAHFNLPSELIVNGVLRSTSPNVAHRVGRDLLETVTRRWGGFNDFFARLVDDVREHFRAVGEAACSAREGDEEQDEAEAYDFAPFIIPLYGDSGWHDEQNLNSAQRARALALKLEERGFVCDFTETELVVALPLRLQGESMEGPAEGDDDEEDDGPFEDEAAAVTEAAGV